MTTESIDLKTNPDMAAIEDIVCKFFNIEKEMLGIKTRKREIVEPRQICMWWREKNTKESLAVIGRRYSSKSKPEGYDHATVLHAKKTVINLKDTDKHFRENISEIEQQLYQYHEKTGTWNYIDKLTTLIDRQLETMGDVFDNRNKEVDFAEEFTDLHYTMVRANQILKTRIVGVLT